MKILRQKFSQIYRRFRHQRRQFWRRFREVSFLRIDHFDILKRHCGHPTSESRKSRERERVVRSV